MSRLSFGLVGIVMFVLGCAVNSWRPEPVADATQLAWRPAADERPALWVLKPARVFDGSGVHENWLVVVRGKKIDSAGPADKVAIPKGARIVALPNATLLPGLIDAHTHLLLHPYNEASWDDQVLKEPLSLRVCRATNHARATLHAGFTTIRDLGTEGAGYADVGLKQAIGQNIIPGPRLLVSTRAIVATGTLATRAVSTIRFISSCVKVGRAPRPGPHR